MDRMLIWYLGWKLFQYISHLLLLHKVRQILHHVLEKCLEAGMLLWYFHWTKSPFQKNSTRSLHSNFFQFIRIYSIHEKFKIQGCWKRFYQKYFWLHYFGGNCYCLPIYLFGNSLSFKTSCLFMPRSSSFSLK